jgi:hypothetical protein
MGIGFTPGFATGRVMRHDRSTVFLNPFVVMTILSLRESWLSTDRQQRQFRAAAAFGLAPLIPSRASSILSLRSFNSLAAQCRPCESAYPLLEERNDFQAVS